MHKTIFLLLWSGRLATGLSAQKSAPVWAVDFVRIKAGHRAETLFFYENNWKFYRDTARARGQISGYRLLETTPDSLGNFDFVLMTAYADSAAQARSEEHFRPILQTLRPDGPQLLNGLPPRDFRENAFFKSCRTVFAAEAKVRRPVKTPPPASLPFLKELHRDIWVPFAKAYAAGDADKYLALHTQDFYPGRGR